MPPFRTRADDVSPVEGPAEPVRDAVAHMVRQFADPFALFRELVQNSLDAGATRIDVRMTHDADEGDAGTLRIVVADDGSGMDRDTVEKCLLVLFRSSKEGDRSKIGKFGVGFFSVFAIEPEAVVVDTGTGDVGWRCTLLPDYTYELEATAPRKGTVVTLKVPASKRAARELVPRAREALARWCPHVRVPLHFASPGVAGAEEDARIDGAFGIDAPVAVVESDPGGGAVAVGAGVAPRAAFFNRGILLHETDEALVPGVAFKVDARDLGHTISRDDVRRDDAFHRAVARARALAHGPLRARLVAEFNAASAAAAGARHADRSDAGAEERLVALAQVVHGSPFAVKPDELEMPLVHPVAAGGRAAAPTARIAAPSLFDQKPRLYAAAPHPVTSALAARGVAVVHTGLGPQPSSAILALLVALHGDAAVADALVRYCAPRVLSPADLDDDERTLLDALTPAFQTAGLGPVAIADPSGAGASRLFLALGADDLAPPPGAPPPLLDARDTEASPFALLGARPVALARRHARVRAAVTAARRDPALAAAALTRLVRLAAGRLDASRDAALLAYVAGGSP